MPLANGKGHFVFCVAAGENLCNLAGWMLAWNAVHVMIASVR